MSKERVCNAQNRKKHNYIPERVSTVTGQLKNRTRGEQIKFKPENFSKLQQSV